MVTALLVIDLQFGPLWGTYRKEETFAGGRRITVDFESMDAHEQYMVHERHVKFSKEIFRPNISDLLIQFFKA